ncbi:MAG: PP2C family protein-serine/threonine phosphatase [Jatrophihabitans sp.]
MTAPEPIVEDRAAGTTILLVEDDNGDAVLVQASLSEVGVPDASVTWSRSLAEALTALAERPSCVLLDLGLPDADGYSAVHKMVEAAPDVAVIVLTGRQERDGIDALAAGAQDYLVKDAITGELLARSIRYAMERKRAERAQQQLREVRLGADEQARLERGLLPTPLLLTESVRCSTYYRPGRGDAVLGGDFFDVVETSEGVVRAVIGDVMGHGPDEAALGVHLRVAWRSLLLAGLPDELILPTLGRLFDAEDDRHTRFATVCDVTIAGGVLTVRVAGHPAPIVYANGATRYLDVRTGTPLGVRPARGQTPSWPQTEVPVPSGSSVLLYTDGLLDAFALDATSDSLGIAELVEALPSCLGATGIPAIPALLQSAPRESIDDTAVVVLTTAVTTAAPSPP